MISKSIPLLLYVTCQVITSLFDLRFTLGIYLQGPFSGVNLGQITRGSR